jgi:hypothetical protein
MPRRLTEDEARECAAGTLNGRGTPVRPKTRPKTGSLMSDWNGEPAWVFKRNDGGGSAVWMNRQERICSLTSPDCMHFWEPWPELVQLAEALND